MSRSTPPPTSVASLLADAVDFYVDGTQWALAEEDVVAACSTLAAELRQPPKVEMFEGDSFYLWEPRHAGSPLTYVPTRVFVDRGGVAYGSEVGVSFDEAEAFALRLLAACRYGRQQAEECAFGARAS